MREQSGGVGVSPSEGSGGASGQNVQKPKLRQESGKAKPSGRLRQEEEIPTPGEGNSPDADSKAAHGGSKLYKSKLRMEKSGDKLDAAREKLAEQKPRLKSGPLKSVGRSLRREAWAYAHGKVYQAEEENVGIKAAHRTELAGESTVRGGVRFVKHRIRTRPARLVRKWEKRDVRAKADYGFRLLAKERPELEGGAVKRYRQKRRLRRQFEKQAKETAKITIQKTGEAAVSAIEKAGRAAVDWLKRNPSAAGAILLCALLALVLQSCMGAAATIGNGAIGAIGGTSYLSTDEDIDEAELRYTEWETDLALQAKNAAATHPGYNEYRYSLAPTGHDPFALLAYLTAKHNDFTFTAIEQELQSLFNQQYTLTFSQIVEVRSYTVNVSAPNGGSYTYTVYYNYYILQTTLTARSFESVTQPLLETQDERDRYGIYMALKGNRQYVGSPFPFRWLPYVSSYYGYRVHPISGGKDYHTGLDIAMPTGTEIQAGGEGVVLDAGGNGGYGLCVLVDYGKGIIARYAHCSALLASAGQTVQAGDAIALVGNTGNSTGPHLHLELLKNGRYLNPLFFTGGTNE